MFKYLFEIDLCETTSFLRAVQSASQIICIYPKHDGSECNRMSKLSLIPININDMVHTVCINTARIQYKYIANTMRIHWIGYVCGNASSKSDMCLDLSITNISTSKLKMTFYSLLYPTFILQSTLFLYYRVKIASLTAKMKSHVKYG